MISKKVILYLNSLNYPINLSVLSESGNIIKNEIISMNCSKICFKTKEQVIKLIARYNNQAVFKTIYLNKFNCEKIYVNFAFNLQTTTLTNIKITLLDKNYNFPIQDALLNFRS